MSTPKIPKSQSRAKPRKTHSNAKLKRLSEKLQEEIVLYAENHSLAKTAEWLKSKNIQVAPSTVSTFLSEHRLRWQFERNAAAVEALLICVKKLDPSITPERIRAAGQNFFSGLAIDNRDAALWNITQHLELRRDQLELAQQRFRESVKQQKAKLSSNPQKTKKGAGIRGETLEQIERELKLM